LEIWSRENDISLSVDNFDGEISRLEAVEYRIDECSGGREDKRTRWWGGCCDDISRISGIGPKDVILVVWVVYDMRTTTTSRSSARVVLASRVEEESFILPSLGLISNSSSRKVGGFKKNTPIHKINRRVRFDPIRDPNLREWVSVEIVFPIEVVDFGAISINLSAISVKKKSSVVVKRDRRRDGFGSCSSSTDRDQRCQSWNERCELHNMHGERYEYETEYHIPGRREVIYIAKQSIILLPLL
jgi:hypothetical protein